MDEEKITLRKSLENDENFLSFLKQEARSDEFLELRKKAEQGGHPSDEMLYHYVLGWLNDADASVVRGHIALCGICAEAVSLISQVESELDEETEKHPARLIHTSEGMGRPKSSGPDLISKLRTWLAMFSARPLIAGFATVCLLIFTIFGLYYKSIAPSDTPTLTSFSLLADSDELGRTRGKTAGEYELKQGGVLQSGDDFAIKFETDTAAYIYLIFQDGSGQTDGLFAGRWAAGKPHIIKHTNEGLRFQLDNTKGTETIYLLASDQEISGFEKKIPELGKIGISDIRKLFPEASVRSFRFRHE